MVVREPVHLSFEASSGKARTPLTRNRLPSSCIDPSARPSRVGRGSRMKDRERPIAAIPAITLLRPGKSVTGPTVLRSSAEKRLPGTRIAEDPQPAVAVAGEDQVLLALPEKQTRAPLHEDRLGRDGRAKHR